MKRLQVFVSSTYTDMLIERQRIVEAVLELGHIPAGMELFAASCEEQLSVIKRWISDSDIFLLILGGKYGSIEPKSGKSYIQLEYEHAKEIGKEPIAIIMKKKLIVEKIANGIYKYEQPEYWDERYINFKAEVQKQTCDFFDDEQSLKIAVYKAIRNCEKNIDKYHGWVSGKKFDNCLGDKKLSDKIDVMIDSPLPKDCTEKLINDYKLFAGSSIYLESDSKTEHFKIDEKNCTYTKTVSRKEVFTNPNKEHFEYSFRTSYGGRDKYENDLEFLHAKFRGLEINIDGESVADFIKSYVQKKPDGIQNKYLDFLESGDIFDLFSVVKDYNSPTAVKKSTIIKAKFPVPEDKNHFTIELRYQNMGELDIGIFTSLSWSYRTKYACKSFKHIVSVEPKDAWIIEIKPFFQYYIFDNSSVNASKDNPLIYTDNKDSVSMVINGWIMPGSGYVRTVKYAKELLLEYYKKDYLQGCGVDIHTDSVIDNFGNLDEVGEEEY